MTGQPGSAVSLNAIGVGASVYHVQSPVFVLEPFVVSNSGTEEEGGGRGFLQVPAREFFLFFSPDETDEGRSGDLSFPCRN